LSRTVNDDEDKFSQGAFDMKKILLVIYMLSTGSLAWAQTAPSLGTAASFAVLGGTNVTCTFPGVITGDVGVSPGSAVPFTNTGCAISGGTPPATDAAAALARTDFLNAYGMLKDPLLTPCTQTISTAAFTDNVPAALGPFPLGSIPPGVYCFAADVTFTRTTLTLDGSTNANGIWIFKVPAALTGTGFQVVLANGAQACNVFWEVDAAATLTTSTTVAALFQGNILLGGPAGSITTTGGSLVGRALANVAVTMTGTNVNGVCALVDQAKASCKNDDDDRDEDKDHHDGDDDHDKGHHRHHHDDDKDHQDNDHRDHD
jgi:ice-binding like protein